MATIPRALPTNRPSCSLKYLRNPQRRFLSTSQPRLAAQTAQSDNIMRNMPKQQSMAARMKKLKRSEIPDDVGILPQTFIRPCGAMPSWFSKPVLRAQLEFLYLRQTFTDFTGSIYMKRWNQPTDPITNKRKKIPLELRNRESEVRHLHEELFTAAAEADRNTINKIACSGLANQQTSRISRAHYEGLPEETWSAKYHGLTIPPRLLFTFRSLIPSFFKSVHIVADRTSQMPFSGLLLRQVTARVDSTQTVRRDDGSAPVTKRLREYVVIQKFIFTDAEVVDAEKTKWKIWGTVKPTTVEEAKDILKSSKADNGGIMDRLRAQVPGLM